MARDRLLWSGFDRLGRFGTPTLAVTVTCGLMIALILFLDVERLASLGSAFLLLLFGMINISVILMREGRLSSYAPGYRSPLYPWMQIVGAVTTIGLIFTLGAFYVVFILAIILLSYVWYRLYVRSRVPNRAALYGLLARLGEQHDEGVDAELWGILQERGADEADSFDELIARARVIEIPDRADLDGVLGQVAGSLRAQLERPIEDLDDALRVAASRGVVPDGAPAAIYDLLRDDLQHPEVVLVRAKRGVRIGGGRRFPGSESNGDDEDGGAGGPRVYSLLFLLSPEGRLTQHLRLLAQLVTMVEDEEFPRRWRQAHDDQTLLETLLRDERFASLVVGAKGPPEAMVNQRLRDVDFPGNMLVALVRRGDQTIVPSGDTLLRAGDRITVIGAPSDVAQLRGRR
jgi:basic amino acid/polyamine antiporter, APA family